MRLVVYLNQQGLERVDLIYQEDERAWTQDFYRALDGALKELDAAARAAAARIQTDGEVLPKPTGELDTRNGSDSEHRQ